MPLRIKDLEIVASTAEPESVLGAAVAARLGITQDVILGLQIRKKSLDARKKSRIVYHYQIDVEVADEDAVLRHNQSLVDVVAHEAIVDPFSGLDHSKINMRHRPVIIGSGPAGIFAALVLTNAGQPCVIIERGEKVEARLRTVNKFRRDGTFDAESNYCFGEGGAGTFSDGKLSCGRNHPLVRFLFRQWVEFGGPKEVLYEAHPHIGTDYLMVITKRMRAHLEKLGTTFIFGRRFVDFTQDETFARYNVKLDDGMTIPTDHLVLAIGHSARETYEKLLERKLALAPKPFAIGARFEHPQSVIDSIQFGNCNYLPPAEYKLVAHAKDRGIWTFCMCPGGHLLPTSAQHGHLAINGMSYHARKSGFANAAVVVNVQREDFFRGHPLDGVRFQEAIEKKAFERGGGNYFTPAQRLKDFLAGRQSAGELKSTYKPGVTSARLDHILPDFVVDSLKVALNEYEKKMRGFLSDEAIVAGVETKTSSPVVMMRDKLTLQSISHPGFFPTGEGAGFAGGIVSAALDGLRVGQAVLDEVLATSNLRVLH